MLAQRLTSEAHLPAFRPIIPVRKLRTGPRRSWLGWAIFVGFIALNEVRGIYVLAEFLKAWRG